MGDYKCAICGKSYQTIKERIACESKCVEEAEKAEEALKKKRLDEEKHKRYESVLAAYDNYEELLSEYLKDYGSIQIGNKHYFDDDLTTLSKVLGWYL